MDRTTGCLKWAARSSEPHLSLVSKMIIDSLFVFLSSTASVVVGHFEVTKATERGKGPGSRWFSPTCLSVTARLQRQQQTKMRRTASLIVEHTSHFEVTKATKRMKGPVFRWFPINWRLCDFTKWPYISICDSQGPSSPVTSARTANDKNSRAERWKHHQSFWVARDRVLLEKAHLTES